MISSMTLKEWIAKKKMTQKEVGKFLNIDNTNPATNVSRYVNGGRIPHQKIMKIIKEKTKNQVTPNDFYEDFWKQNKI
jgi:transcriptional regulator with XRE-family HTH domain